MKLFNDGEEDTNAAAVVVAHEKKKKNDNVGMICCYELNRCRMISSLTSTSATHNVNDNNNNIKNRFRKSRLMYSMLYIIILCNNNTCLSNSTDIVVSNNTHHHIRRSSSTNTTSSVVRLMTTTIKQHRLMQTVDQDTSSTNDTVTINDDNNLINTIDESSSSPFLYNFTHNRLDLNMITTKPTEKINSPYGDTTNTSSSDYDSDKENYYYDTANNEHKNLYPLNQLDYIGIVLTIIGLLIASGGGIGGGGILVPILILIMNFTTKHAIPISNVTVVGGAIANVLYCIKKRHPAYHNKTLIDWDLIIIMEPITILGAWFGTIANKILPEIIVTISLVLLLCITSIVTFQKAICLYQKETLIFNNHNHNTKSLASTATTNEESIALIQPQTNRHHRSSETTPISTPTTTSTTYESIGITTNENKNHTNKILLEDNNPILYTIIQKEQYIPYHHIMILLSTVLVVVFVNLLKGGGTFPSPINMICGSLLYWFINSFLILYIIGVTIYSRQYLIQQHRLKQSCHYYKYYDTNVPNNTTTKTCTQKMIQWNHINTIVYPLISMTAGFFAGMFGIGGGIIKGPLMLVMGIHPAVSAASSAVMILCTSFTATTSYIIYGFMINNDYITLYFIIGFIVTLIGQTIISYIIQKSNNRNSYIIFSIGIIVIISAILMSIQSIESLITHHHHDQTTTNNNILRFQSGICT